MQPFELRQHTRPFRHGVVLLLLAIVWCLSYSLPERIWNRIGAFLGGRVGPFVLNGKWLKSRLDHALPTAIKPSRHYADLGQRAFESFRLSRTARRCVLTPASEALLNSLACENKGILILSAHFGHWEAMGLKLHRLGYQFSVVSTLGKTDMVNRFLQWLRARAGLTVLTDPGSASTLVRALKSGENVSLFIDVPSRIRTQELPFLGETVLRSTVSNRLARLTDATCIFVFNQRTKTGMYQICAERVPAHAQPLQWCHARLEELVEKAPSQWLWLLDRPRS